MTNFEFTQTICSRFGLSEGEISALLLSQSVNADDEADPIICKTALCKEFAMMIPLQNVGEGGYSVSWNMEAVKLWYSMTCKELGLTDATQPRIRNKSNRW